MIDVTIDNRCTNIALTSPVHFTKDAACHGHLSQQVDSKSIMKVGFKSSMDQDTFGGALLYHLQRKKNNESNHQSNTDKDVSISTQLLMIWEFKINRLYSHSWLIDYESSLIWNEDTLKKLYDVYNNQSDTELIFDSGKWMLNDNKKSQITCKTSYKGGFKMNTIISEEENLIHPIKPLWVDSNR
jgi:hypothetical protein